MSNKGNKISKLIIKTAVCGLTGIRFFSFGGSVIFDLLIYVNNLNQVTELPLNESSKIIPPEQACQVEGIEKPLATNIWFFVMGQNYLDGITPAALDNMFVTRSTILPDGSAQVYHVTMPVGIALGSLSALSVIKNATIPQTA